MKLSEHFSLGKSQNELDFVDIDLSSDTAVFVDPILICKRLDVWSQECNSYIQSFFGHLLSLLRGSQVSDAEDMFLHFREPNLVHLGLSKGVPRGRGIGASDSQSIIRNMISSAAFASGLVKDIEDNVLFIDNFGEDKLSDMLVQILYLKLNEYTIDQCKLHDIPVQPNVANTPHWSLSSNSWMFGHSEGLVANNSRKLLVPKGIVSFTFDYDHHSLYHGKIVNFIQQDQIRISGPLVQRRVHTKEPFVTKKSIEERYPNSKEFVTRFCQDHPYILEKYKSDKRDKTHSIPGNVVSVINLRDLCQALIDKLRQIPPGSDGASDYHNLIYGISELIFYPFLSYPKKEAEIRSGVKRVDIIYHNSMTLPFFQILLNTYNIESKMVHIECKNYSSDPANAEMDQLLGRFSRSVSQFGFMFFRTLNNEDLFKRRCREEFSHGRGLILFVTDSDLINILSNIATNQDHVDTFLFHRLREIIT
jgi:hypothetical protein